MEPGKFGMQGRGLERRIGEGVVNVGNEDIGLVGEVVGEEIITFQGREMQGGTGRMDGGEWETEKGIERETGKGGVTGTEIGEIGVEVGVPAGDEKL